MEAKKKADIATPLMFLFLVAVALCVWIYASNAGEYSSEDAQNAMIYSLTDYGSAVLESVDDSYNGTAIEIHENIGGHFVYRIKDDLLKGSRVRHVLISSLPNSVEDNAFSGVNGLILYADDSRVAMQSWAQGLEIRSEDAFWQLVSEMGSSNVQANLKQLFKDGVFITILAAVLLAGFCLLGKLRQITGHENPFSILIENKFCEQLFRYGAALGFVLGMVILYCENIEIDPELFETVNGYANSIGIPIVTGMLGIVVLRDLFRKDILWFPARIFVRGIIAGSLAVLGMVIGSVLSALANEIWLVGYAVLLVGISVVFFTLAALIYPIIRFLGVDQFMEAWERGSDRSAEDAAAGTGGGTKSDSFDPIVVRDSHRNLRTARAYSQGTYVADDFIVARGEHTLIGESGEVYRKEP